MIAKWIHQLFFESPLFETQWQNISLLDIAEQKKIDPNTVAASDFYEAFYRKLDKSGKKSWSRCNYYDLQSHALESIIQPGLGIGLIRGDNMELTPRFKLWAGWFALGSYEFINMKNDDNKHYYSLFGVLPLPIGVSGI